MFSGVILLLSWKCTWESEGILSMKWMWIVGILIANIQPCQNPHAWIFTLVHKGWCHWCHCSCYHIDSNKNNISKSVNKNNFSKSVKFVSCFNFIHTLESEIQMAVNICFHIESFIAVNCQNGKDNNGLQKFKKKYKQSKNVQMYSILFCQTCYCPWLMVSLMIESHNACMASIQFAIWCPRWAHV